MISQTDYLRDEFRRYFPDATLIAVSVTDETITVDVSWDLNYTVFQMTIGSDDDCYRFTNTVTDAVITVPFEPEED